MEKRGIDVDAIESELESDSETRDIEGLQRRVEELLEAMESGAKGGEEEAVRALAGLSGYKGSS